ncbi:MAG: nitrogenase component 1 [Methanoregula sp.]|jgi:nitrogenase molybdenum-cofactor synthesis protein NifE
MSRFQDYEWTQNPEFCPGLVDMCAGFPLRIAGTPGKCPGGLEVATHIKNCIPLYHAPAGCAFQRKVHPFHQWELSYDIPCSGLSEVETIYGGNDRLFHAIKEVARRYKPDLIMVISTCTSEIIGEDFESVLEAVRKEIPCEVVYTNGYVRFPRPGIRDALCSVIDQVVPKNQQKIKHSVNICTLPWGFFDVRMSGLKELLETIGVTVNGVYFAGTTVKQLKLFSRAELIVTDDRRAWCELAEEKFGMKTISLHDASRHMSWGKSLDYHPGSLNGIVFFLQNVARELDLGDAAIEKIDALKTDAEKKLGTWKQKLKGTRISMSSHDCHNLGTLMVRELGMECGVLIVKHPKWSFLKKETMDNMIQGRLEIIRECQHSDPLVLEDPTIEEEIAALKQNDIDIAINPSNIPLCRREGIRAFRELRFLCHHDPPLGFTYTLDLAKEMERLLKKPVPKTPPLLSLIRYSSSVHYPNMTDQWAKAGECFQSIWACDSCEEGSHAKKETKE